MIRRRNGCTRNGYGLHECVMNGIWHWICWSGNCGYDISMKRWSVGMVKKRMDKLGIRE